MLNLHASCSVSPPCSTSSPPLTSISMSLSPNWLIWFLQISLQVTGGFQPDCHEHVGRDLHVLHLRLLPWVHHGQLSRSMGSRSRGTEEQEWKCHPRCKGVPILSMILTSTISQSLRVVTHTLDMSHLQHTLGGTIEHRLKEVNHQLDQEKKLGQVRI